MIIQKTKKFIFPITRYYFGFDKIKKNIILDFFSVTEIIQSKEKLNLNWFKEEIFNTGIINLKENKDIIFKNFSSTVRNEINRAKREWIMYKIIDNFKSYKKEYIKFYNKFATLKWLPIIKHNHFNWLESNIYLTAAYYDNSILVYHLYIFDKNIWRIRLLQSCSLFRDNKLEINKNLIWYANKWLHYFDMIKFKELWFLEYDFWWLYLWETDIEKRNIDKFKLRFWPQIEINYNYVKYWLFFKFLFKILWKK